MYLVVLLQRMNCDVDSMCRMLSMQLTVASVFIYDEINGREREKTKNDYLRTFRGHSVVRNQTTEMVLQLPQQPRLHMPMISVPPEDAV